jgi:hypothetical protein
MCVDGVLQKVEGVGANGGDEVTAILIPESESLFLGGKCKKNYVKLLSIIR